MRTVVAASMLAVVVACGGGSIPSGTSAVAPGGGGDSTALTAEVGVTFPNLLDQGGAKVLPTYVSHVISSATYPLASISIRNTGPAITGAVVSVSLSTFGAAGTRTVSLARGETKTLSLSPVIDYPALFQVTSPLPGALEVTVTVGATTLFSQTYPIRISGRDTVFWSSNGQSLAPLIGAMVTPTDRAGKIAALLRNAATRFPGETMLGYQLGAIPSQAIGPIDPGSYEQERLYALEGESPTVTIDGVTLSSRGDADVATVAITDDANFEAWTSGSSATACAFSATATAGTVLACPAVSSAGWYHVIYFNPSSNAAARTVSRRRPMTRWESTYRQTQAIFEELRAEGLLYVNLPGTGFFATAQNVKYPSESLSTRSANCVDGALVFASAWEAMSMEPLVALDFVHGHSFVAVRCWSGTADCMIPVETTMVGSSASFADAVSTAAASWTAWTSAGTLEVLDIEALREAGLTPAPM